jgi:hypothetical protein
MNLLILNLVIGIMDIFLMQYNTNNETTDPNDSLKEINNAIDDINDEKLKSIAINLANMAIDNPLRLKLIIYLVVLIPIINILLFWGIIKSMYSHNKQN